MRFKVNIFQRYTYKISACGIEAYYTQNEKL